MTYYDDEIVVIDTEIPTPPDPLIISTSTADSIEISWGESTDDIAVDYYQIHRRIDLGSWAVIATTTSLSYNDLGLALFHDYTYRVRAVDTSGNFSLYSNEVTETL